MKTENKYCEDCKHYIPPDKKQFMDWTPALKPHLYVPRCGSPKAGTNLVNRGRSILVCEETRIHPALCGVEGKWFEAKEELKND